MCIYVEANKGSNFCSSGAVTWIRSGVGRVVAARRKITNVVTFLQKAEKARLDANSDSRQRLTEGRIFFFS